MHSFRNLKWLFLITALILVGWWSFAPESRLGETRQPLPHGAPRVAGVTEDPISHVALPIASVTEPGVSEVAAGEEMKQFTSWTQRYLAAVPAERVALEKEGIELAGARRPVFQKLIQTDPRAALEQAVPRVVRQDLPGSVVAALEVPISAKGDLNVYMGRPAPGLAVPAEGLVLRYFEAQGVSFKAHVFGALEHVTSRQGVPLQGVAIDRDLAVAENAVRRLELGERIPAGVVVEETCPVSGLTTLAVATGAPVTEQKPTVEIGSRIITLCNGSHVAVLENDFRTYVQASGPGGGGFFMDNFPGTASRAIGNFRCLYIRVTYPDQMAQPNTEEQAYADMRDNARYYLENSYGKMTQTTTVTSLITLPHTLAWYKAKDGEVDCLGLIHTESRNAARALGYDPNQFDCTIVRINQGPRLEGISWGGGSSVWITWDGMDVLNHECGHSLGRNHANSWDSLDGTPYGYGQNGEYGNPFDVMGGSGGFSAHYNTISKRALGWLPDNALHFAKGNGVYRIYAYDQPTLEEGKRYGLNVAKDSVRQYNLEFHPARGGYLADDALVLYSGMGSNAGHLVDTTQGSSAGKYDGGIALGRTFSDLEADMHFTVVSKNVTMPASLDIAFNRGPFAGNVAPTATFTASATSIAAGTSVTFTATANDANGDALAYRWECDDGVSGPNSNVYTRTFSSVAQTTVMLTVSDMKGGTVRRSVVINVGSHGQQTVTGTITAGGLPLQGVYLSNGSKSCFTDVDGTYLLAGLTTGSHILTAVLNGYTLTPAFANPFTVVSGTNTANWTATGATFVTLAKLADATEGGATGTFRFTRTGSTAAALTVLVSPAGGTAIKGTDYAFSPDYTTSGSFRAFTIAAGSATLDVTVSATGGALNDTVAEGPETITLQLAGAAGYLSNSGNAVVMQLNDNDTVLPQVSVTAPDSYATEAPAGDTGTFTFARTGLTTLALNLAVAWSGTATNGTDCTLLPTTVTILAGQSSVNVTVTSIDDSLIEVPEDIIATISANAAYVRDSTSTTASVSITDDDTPIVTVSVPDATASESGANAGLFLISRTGSTAAPLKVYYGLSGSALHGTDYAPLTGEVTIPAGATSASVVISPYNDDVAEPTETVTLGVANFNDTYGIGVAFQGSVTIADNADTPLINVRSGTVGAEGGANPTVIFHSIGNGSGNVSVSYTVSGTATSGSDFTTLSGTVSVPVNGSNDTTVTIPVINDTLAESTETVVVKITPSANYRFYNDGVAEAVIQDNDSGGDRVMVSTYNQSPSETGPTPGTFYFSRTGTAGALTVNYSISGTATNGVDYTSLSGSVIIPDTQSGINLVMTPINDVTVEGTETVTLTVLPGTGYGPDRPASATFEIADNESPTITVGFQQAAMTTTEVPTTTGEYRDLPVVLSAASSNTITVNYNSAGGNAAGDDVDWAFVDPDNGNAIIPGGTLTFIPGVTSKIIRLRIKNDGVTEGGETAIVQLLAPFNASFTKGRSQESVMIFDEVIPLLVTEERWNSGSVYTNNTWTSINADYTAYLTSFTSTQDVADDFSRRMIGQIVAPATGVYNFWTASDDASRLYLGTNSTAASKVQVANLSSYTSFQNWDANASQKSANINLVAGQSYYMEVQHQEGGGGDHVSVAWQGPGFARIPISFATQDVSPFSIRLLSSATTRLESDGTEPLLQVVLDRPAGSTAISVDYTVSGTATSGTDYTLTPGTLTFAVGEQMKPIPLSLLTDAVGEAAESIIVSISNPVGATLAAPAMHTITLLDASVPTVETLFATAASSQSVGTVLATAVATPAAGRTISSWTILSGNTNNVFAINASGQLTLAVPGSLPNPGGLQLIVRATDNLGAAGEGVINMICNSGTQAVVEQRWTGSSAFWSENWTGATVYAGKLSILTTAQDVSDNYSRRLTSYLKPQVTGDYTFWIAGDDDCRLYLSTDGYQANKVLISAVNGWTYFQSWDSSNIVKSVSIPLVAGKVYWIEAQQVEGGGGDHVSVAWAGPGISRVAIPSTVLVPTAAGINFTVPTGSFANTAPTITDVTNKTTSEDTSSSAIAFTVGDSETAAASLPVSASSANAALVPNGNIVLSGSGASRTVTLTPALNQTGTTTITLTVTDGNLTASDTFVLTVSAANDAPTISAISNQSLAIGGSSSVLPFTVGDVETFAASLTVTKSSSNTLLVPAANIVLGGSGMTRTAMVTAAANQVGSAIITLTVSDGALTTNTTFLVTVNGTPFQTWRQQWFNSIVTSGNAANDADPDFDGVSNLREYAVGTNPTVPNSPMSGITSDTEVIGANKYLRLSVAKNPAATDITYQIQVCSDLAQASWTTAGTTQETNSATTLTVRDSTSLNTSWRRFIRFNVTSP